MAELESEIGDFVARMVSEVWTRFVDCTNLHFSEFICTRAPQLSSCNSSRVTYSLELYADEIYSRVLLGYC